MEDMSCFSGTPRTLLRGKTQDALKSSWKMEPESADSNIMIPFSKTSANRPPDVAMTSKRTLRVPSDWSDGKQHEAGGEPHCSSQRSHKLGDVQVMNDLEANQIMNGLGLGMQ